VVCLSVMVKIMRRSWPTRGSCAKEENKNILSNNLHKYTLREIRRVLYLVHIFTNVL